MRVVLYARVSGEDQVRQYGLSAQIAALRHLAATNDYEVVAEIADEGISGTVEDRPGLRRVRDALQQGIAGGVLIFDLSRLARDVVLCLRLLKEFKDLGAHVEFVNLKVEDTPESEMFAVLNAGMAAFERSKMRQRVAGGRRAKAERGFVPGAPYPFGYVGDKAVSGGLRIIEREAEIVRSLFIWAADGLSLREMVRRLNAQGIRTRRGQNFNKCVVSKMIRNETYRGEYISHRVRGNPNAPGGRSIRPEKDWVRIKVEPIVSEMLWAKAQDTFKRNLSAGRADKLTRSYLLKRLVFCGQCGRRYVGGKSHGKAIYTCTGRDTLLGDRRCRSRSLNADVVEAEIRTTIRNILDDPAILFGAAERHRAQIAGRQVDVHREVKVAKDQLTALGRRRANLLDLAEDGAISKELFRERDTPLKLEADRLQRRVAELTAEATSSAARASRQKAVLAHAKLLRSGLGKLDEAGWRNLLVKLVERVVVHADGLELHLVLPTAQVAIQRSNQSSSNCSTLSRSGFGSFNSSW